MEKRKRCTNCGKYPFCKEIKKPTFCCDKWIKNIRNKEIKYVKN